MVDGSAVRGSAGAAPAPRRTQSFEPRHRARPSLARRHLCLRAPVRTRRLTQEPPRIAVAQADDRSGQRRVNKSTRERPSLLESKRLNGGIWSAAPRAREMMTSTFDPKV